MRNDKKKQKRPVMLKVLEGPSTRRLWWRTARQCLLRPEAVLGGRLEVRHLTGTEVSTALRPFYFLVHPDLFGKYPKEQIQNEKSLKILKNYVDTLVHDKKRPNPSEVSTFSTGKYTHLTHFLGEILYETSWEESGIIVTAVHQDPTEGD